VLAPAARAGLDTPGDPDAKSHDRPAIAHTDRDGLAKPKPDSGGQSDSSAHLPRPVRG
jgi:hypothetical protein